MPGVKAEIARYLETGDSDPIFSAWPGDVLERCGRGSAALRDALIREVQQRTRGLALPSCLPAGDLAGFARSRVEPMVAGLFPVREREPVLFALAQSVMFVTPDTVESVLRDEWLSAAWDLANLYLGSVGAKLLSPNAPRIVGLSTDRTCYVTLRYFEEKSPLADFIVHETAHVFHNCKRATIGLPATRRREWLLDIDFQRRETFAYACEALSRLLALGRNRSERGGLLDEHDSSLPGDESVDLDEYLDILREAIGARNGWKRILARCAPPRAPRRPAERRGVSPGERSETTKRDRP